jgi:hypothetical protein
VRSEDIHRNGEGQQMGGHAEDAVDNVSSTEDIFSEGSEEDSTNVSVARNLDMISDTP